MSTFVIMGEPKGYTREQLQNRSIMDQRRTERISAQQKLEDQLDGTQYKGPLQLHVTFYIPIPPKVPKHTIESFKNRPAVGNTPLVPMLRFLEEALQHSLLDSDATITLITATKKYDDLPRTEIFLMADN